MHINTTISDIATRILDDVHDEVASAMIKHGPMHSRHEAYAVILEELDEFWEEVRRNPLKMSLSEFDAHQTNMRKELIQTAAMCVRAIVDLGLEDK